MTTEHVHIWIKHAKRKGASKHHIHRKLLDSGYTHDHIESLFKELSYFRKKKINTVIMILSVVFIILILYLLFLLFF